MNKMYTRLTAVPNRTLLYDVYQYVWDAKETTMLLDSYIAWLGERGGYFFWRERELVYIVLRGREGPGVFALLWIFVFV